MTSRFWLSLILIPKPVAIVVALIADLDTPTPGLIGLDQRSVQHLKAEIGTELAHQLPRLARTKMVDKFRCWI